MITNINVKCFFDNNYHYLVADKIIIVADKIIKKIFIFSYKNPIINI